MHKLRNNNHVKAKPPRIFGEAFFISRMPVGGAHVGAHAVVALIMLGISDNRNYGVTHLSHLKMLAPNHLASRKSIIF